MRVQRCKFVIWLLGMVFIAMSPTLCPAADADEEGAKPEGKDKPEHTWQLSLAPTYTSGNFGTATRTDFLYVPLTVRRLFQDGDIALVLPYVCATTNGRVTLVGGVPNRIDRRGGSGSSGPGGGASLTAASGSGLSAGPSGGGGLDDTVLAQGVPVGGRITNCGVGDIILRGRYYLVDESGFLPTIALTGRVKIPTADKDKGLGTGEFDEGAGLEFSKTISEKFIGFVDLGYTIIGKPAGFALRNQWFYDVGLGYYVTKALLISVYYEEYRALVSGLQNPRDLLFTANYKATSALRFNASVLVGLSNGAPEYGLTGGISVRF